jgi:hypothetical protein
MIVGRRCVLARHAVVRSSGDLASQIQVFLSQIKALPRSSNATAWLFSSESPT